MIKRKIYSKGILINLHFTCNPKNWSCKIILNFDKLFFTLFITF